ncbi:MAG TPA: SRPBCC domain-containing protein [Pseudonocardiaceae bacterium]|jgi:uncharacterized protein YndB with AHSA1/START domain
MTTTTKTVQVHRVYIKATAQAIWDAITDPEWNKKYGYESPSEYDLRPGGAYRVLPSGAMREHGAPEVIIDGEIIESDPPRKLVQTWRALFNPELAAEGFTRLTWEIDEEPAGISKLTLTHELDGAPKTAQQVGGEIPGAGGGWSYILSDLKTLLETGKTLGS